MGVLDDAWEATGGRVVDAASDVASSIVENIPGGSELAGALSDLAKGPLRDFANTAVGRVVLQAVASTFYGSVAWTLGPQLASVAFAVPGLAAGDDFTTAYLQGVKTRAEQTAQIIGVPGLGDFFGRDLAKTLRELATEYGIDERILEAGVDIAKRLGVRLDAADFARAMWNREPLPDPSKYALDGSRLPAGVRSLVGLMTPSAISRATRAPAYVNNAAAQVLERSKAAQLVFGNAPSPAPVERASSAPSSAPSGAAVLVGVVGAVVAVGAGAWYLAGRR